MIRRSFARLFGPSASSPSSKRAAAARQPGAAGASVADARRRLTLEPLEARVLLAGTVNDPLPVGELQRVRDGLHDVAEWADQLDAFGQVGRSLPLVGKSIGEALDVGGLLRDKLFATVDALVPTAPSPQAIATAIQGALPAGAVVTPSVTADAVRFDLAFTAPGAPLSTRFDFGANGAAVSTAPTSADLDVTTSLDAKFAFGLDLTPGLSSTEAFFIDTAGGKLEARAVASLKNGTFALNLGFLGGDAAGAAGARVEGGTLSLKAGVGVALLDQDADGKIRLEEIGSTTLGSLVSLTPLHDGADVTANLPVTAKLGSFTGSGTVTVADADLFDATAPAVALASTDLGDFKNLTPAGVVSLVRNVGTSLQTLAGKLNPDGGVPFVGKAIGEAVSFGDLLDRMTRPLFDVKLDGAAAHTAEDPAAATVPATALTLAVTTGPNVVVERAITVAGGSAADVVSAINTAIDDAASPIKGLVAATLADGRVKFAANDPNHALAVRFAADDAGMDALGFAATLSNAVFRFDSVQTLIPLLAAKMGVSPAALALDFDAANKTLLFNVKYADTFTAPLDLDFSETIDLGVGELGVTGEMRATVAATAGADLRLGINLANLTDFDPEDPAYDALSQAGANDVFVLAGGKVSGKATFKGGGDLAAAIGLLELGVTGATADFTAEGGLTLSDFDDPTVPGPSDGKVHPGEFIKLKVDDLSPTVGASGSVTLPLTLTGAEDVGVTLPANAAVKLNFGSTPTTIEVDADVTGLEDLIKQFTNFSTDNVLGVLKQLVGLIQNSDLPLFNEPLPLVGKSLKELLSFGDSLVAALDEATSGVSDLRARIIGGSADVQALADGAPFLQGLKDVIAGDGFLNKVLDAGRQAGGDAVARAEAVVKHLTSAVEGIWEGANLLPEVVADPANFKIPAGLVSAVKHVSMAIEEGRAFAATLPAGEPRTSIEANLDQLEDKLGPIADALPSVQRLASYLFDALGLGKLVDLEALQATVRPVLEQVRDALPAGGAQDAVVKVLDLLDDALAAVNPAALADFGPAAAPGLPDAFKLLEALDELRKLVDTFGQAGGPLADDPMVNDEPGDKVRQALAGFATSIPGQPTVALDGEDLNIGFAFNLDEKLDDQALDFDLTGGSDLIPLDVVTGGTIDLRVGAALKLDFGVDLAAVTDVNAPGYDPLAALYFRDSTELSLNALVDAADLTAAVSIGGVNAVELGTAADPGVLTLKNDANDGSAKFGLELKDTPDGKIKFSDFGLDDFGLFEDGALNLSVPIYVNGSPVTVNADGTGGNDPLTLTVADLKTFGDLDFNIPANLLSKLESELLSLEFLFKGLRSYIDKLTGGMLGDIIQKFPFIGNTLDLLETSLGGLLAPSSSAPDAAAKASDPAAALAQPKSGFAPGEGFIDKLEDRIAGLNDVGEALVEGALKQIFFDLLGPDGLKILKLDANTFDSDPGDGPTDTVIDFNDVMVDVTGDLTAADTKIIAKLPLGTSEDVIEADFDLGFNGLGLVGFQTTGGVAVGLDWSVDLAFELSKSGGFTVLLDQNPFNVADTTEVELKANAHLKEGTKLNANLFFLALEATDRAGNGPGSGTSLSAVAGLDIEKSGDRLPVNDFSGLKFKPSLTANMHVDLALRTGFSTGKITPNANLPALTANLLVDWDFLSADGSGVSANSPKLVALNDISLDLGQFIGKALGPLIDKLNDYLAPIKPILDFLEQEIPVISQVAQLVGQDPVKFIDAIKALGDGADTVARLAEVLGRIATIVAQANTIANQGPLVIPFGDLVFTGADALDKKNSAGLFDRFKAGTAGTMTDEFTDAFAALNGDAKDFINDLTGNAPAAKFGSIETAFGTFSIPLFESPSDIVGLLFGRDIDLVTWDVPRLEAKFEFSQLFGPIIPPFPVFAKIGGGFGIFADLYMGMDTRGIRTGDFFKGIYFGDTVGAEAGAEETPELGVSLEFKAGAELSIPFAKAGVEGGIQAEITADWNDPDKNGRVHFDEVAANFQKGIQCVFDLAGKLDAFIGAYLNIEIPLGFTSITIVDVSFDIFRATLFDFSYTCPPLPEPIPGTLDADVLRLNIGDRAGVRQPGATDGEESIEVFGEGERDGQPGLSMTTDVNGDGKITEDELGDLFPDGTPADATRTTARTGSVAVFGFGVLQFHHGVAKIVGRGGNEDDSIVLDAFVSVPTELSGDGGDDNVTGGSGRDTIAGGDGADVITGGRGDDLITGGAANDQLAGNAGSDVVRGDDGDDQLFGGSNDGVEGGKTPGADDDDLADTVEGGNGNDQLYGHLGGDNLAGGQGADTLGGGAGDDTLAGGDDNDLVFGDAGDDAMTGGAGDDQMKGGDGADDMAGQAGRDYMEGGNSGGTGGADPDVVDGGTENDSLIGGSADDKAGDVDGADNIIGGGGDDTILGDNGIIGSVTLFGGLGDDTLSGGAGADLIYGQGGDDTVDAGSENDVVFGGAGGDTVHGDAGADLVLGEADDDDIFGDAGNDTVEAGLGADEVYGGTGSDLLKGQEDDDYIEGNADGDTILGGVGHDSVIGGSSGAGDLAAGLDAGDSIVGSAGNDIVLGDNGTIDGLNVTTNAAGGAGPDTVFGGADSDTIFGGGAGDVLNGDSAVDSGNDLVVGDQGTRDATTITADHSDVAGSAGDDSVFGSAGNDTLLGGDGNDTISGDAGTDVALGDNGKVTLNGATVVRTETTDAAFGGNDSVTGGAGDDVILGGTGDDLLDGGTADAGRDIVLGDNGVVVGPNGAEDANDVFTREPAFGGVDAITGGAGDDILLGGSAGDSVDGGEGNDVALGDHGQVIRDGAATPVVQRIATTSPDQGGNDSMVGGFGGDSMLGGFGADLMTGDLTADDDVPPGVNVADVLLGDNGFLQLVTTATNPVRVITTANPNDGDSDTITAGDGNDTVMGGTASESILGGSGSDLVFGDHGKVLLDQPSNSNFVSIDTAASQGGAPDTVRGESGDDTVLGGQGGDVLLGGTQDDDLIGGHNVAGGADAGDTVDGGSGDDLLAGDNANVIRQAGPDYTSPLVRTLGAGGTMYNAAGAANVDPAARRNPSGAVGRDVTLLDHANNTAAGLFGNDYMAGGADDDSVFGQLGDDRVQGDASVDEAVGMATPFVADASVNNPLTDGDDYVEGNGGADLVFGNLGQDDLVGGSSSLFGLNAPAARPDGADSIFGGAGDDTAINTPGDAGAGGHAADADMVVGDNANVFRLVTQTGGTTAFVTFNYDTAAYGATDPARYSRTRLIPRAIDLLDYSADGNAANDTGGGDLLHGEAGDDSVHGSAGNDVLFGEGQDDDLFGESGADWISGGTGEDGVLGDDGKILTSRNGVAEPVYNLVAVGQQIISTPGQGLDATTHATGRLNKAVDLEPFGIGGDDVVYGGLGDDRLHGGAGNDGISGAEALANFYADPRPNPTSTAPIVYDPVTGNFAGFLDAKTVQSLIKINGQVLNFLATDAANAKVNDGADAIFGDDGHDWLVGGTQSDRLYGGMGNDILNADDNLETRGGLNDEPDAPAFADADTAFGGGGRDTLLGNTGADRLVDWNGEFNAYVVPFSPFGRGTVIRAHQPQIVRFLYDLSRSDGADPTRVGPGLGTADRNGEPFAELGLILPGDPGQHDQTGGPADPQPGNNPGGKKD